jgi:low affinity Fe/Cu permease
LAAPPGCAFRRGRRGVEPGQPPKQAGGREDTVAQLDEERFPTPHTEMHTAGTETSKPQKPSEVSSRVGFFDRFAGRAAHVASRAPFFAFCLALVIIWAPSYFLLRNLDTWQLIINTATTIITFLMVALLQNTQTRNDMATQHKLNAIADGLADLMRHVGGENPEVANDIKELRTAVGLEERESTS